MGSLFAQQLVTRGEELLDVPATLASGAGARHGSFQQERPQ
jgi:hypothetical protein